MERPDLAPYAATSESSLGRKPPEALKDNRQSRRIVDLLEERYAHFDGLNLSYETREGIAKHSSEYDRPTDQAVREFDGSKYALLEAQIIDYADEIAYNNHDIDDGLESGYISLGALEQVDLWRETWERVGKKFPGIDENRQVRQTISHLIGRLIEDLVETTSERLRMADIVNTEQVRTHDTPLAGFSSELEQKNRALKDFLHAKLYRHHKVERMRIKAQLFLTRLFECYHDNPTLLPESYQARYQTFGCERVICDYMAGMTDRFALDEYKRLFEPYERV